MKDNVRLEDSELVLFLFFSLVISFLLFFCFYFLYLGLTKRCDVMSQLSQQYDKAWQLFISWSHVTITTSHDIEKDIEEFKRIILLYPIFQLYLSQSIDNLLSFICFPQSLLVWITSVHSTSDILTRPLLTLWTLSSNIWESLISRILA